MRRRMWALVLVVVALASLASPAAGHAPSPVADDGTLGMRTVSGFGDLGRLTDAEALLGRSIRWVVVYADRSSPAAMRASVFGQFRSPRATLPPEAARRDVILSVPLAFGQATAATDEGRTTIRDGLAQTAAGAWDADYRTVARNLAAAGFGDALVRLGHEMTGVWYPWSAVGNGEGYVAAFRHVREVMLAAAPGLRFEWTAARLGFEEHGPAAYPGDDAVDVIGLDLYHDPDQPMVLDDDLWERRYGRVLRAHRDFAVARGKPLAYDEWANDSVDEPEFIRRMYEWFASLPPAGPGRLVVQAYFNPASSRFDLAGYPRSRATVRELFGAVPDGGPLDTPSGRPVTKTFRRDGRPGGTVTFALVEAAGTTTVRPLRRGDDDWVEPAGFYLSRTDPVVLAVTTSATVAGPVTICAVIPPGSLPAGQRPQLLQFGSGRFWAPVTRAVQQDSGRVCGSAELPARFAVGTGFDVRPVADGDRSVSGAVGTPLSVTARADHGDGGDVTFGADGAGHGMVSVSGTACAGDYPRRCTATLTYRPDPGWSGADAFTYIADDGATVSDPVTVSVLVTPPPGREPGAEPLDGGLRPMRAPSPG